MNGFPKRTYLVRRDEGTVDEYNEGFETIEECVDNADDKDGATIGVYELVEVIFAKRGVEVLKRTSVKGTKERKKKQKS